MLAPTDAISLVSSVIQLVDFSSKLVAKWYELSTSLDGAVAENRDAETINVNLAELNNKLIPSIDNSRRQSVLMVDKLLERLQKLKAQPGKNGHWQSIRRGLKTVWGKDDIDEIAKRLDRY
ncbi:hypothetical protein AOQ84DRAFT_306768 [Glonium stellatum]|uniref:Fungal N-terminal domain-containing protein n=1 Tax=Glonium stellatum TaxID=574774 RepID=A0A8E2EMI8_9PEZI|nr:hypothetical protein AOQ84DRAFT_306768 [Glonium stellatum]